MRANGCAKRSAKTTWTPASASRTTCTASPAASARADLKDASKALELALAHGDKKNLLGLVRSFEMALTEVLESAESLASGVSFGTDL